jgi:hypothetical protein
VPARDDLRRRFGEAEPQEDVPQVQSQAAHRRARDERDDNSPNEGERESHQEDRQHDRNFAAVGRAPAICVYL